MLPAHILDAILRRERARSQVIDDRPCLELPVPERAPLARQSEEEKEDAGRGVLVVDLF